MAALGSPLDPTAMSRTRKAGSSNDSSEASNSLPAACRISRCSATSAVTHSPLPGSMAARREPVHRRPRMRSVLRRRRGRAASCAANGSIAERSSSMSATRRRSNPGPWRHAITSGSVRRQLRRGRTDVPTCGRDSISPLAASTLKASRTTLRDAPKRTATCSRSMIDPGVTVPSTISRPTPAATCPTSPPDAFTGAP